MCFAEISILSTLCCLDNCHKLDKNKQRFDGCVLDSVRVCVCVWVYVTMYQYVFVHACFFFLCISVLCVCLGVVSRVCAFKRFVLFLTRRVQIHVWRAYMNWQPSMFLPARDLACVLHYFVYFIIFPKALLPWKFWALYLKKATSDCHAANPF